MVVFGGGHNDYFGSDVHAFDLATREWRCLSHGYVDGPPSAYGAGAVYPTSVYPDNSPLPPHTYDYVQYDDQANNLILLKGQTELGPNVKAAPIPHLFNLDTLSWQHGRRLQQLGCQAAPIVGSLRRRRWWQRICRLLSGRHEYRWQCR